MILEVVFLGTGASVPSRERSLPCTAVRRESDITLFDCGEGSQRQLMCSSLSFMKVERIMVSHLHGDHVLGIPGLLQTMSLSGRSRPLTIAGPAGLEDAVRSMLDLCQGDLAFPLYIQEMAPGERLIAPGFDILAVEGRHNMESLSYVYREEPRSGRMYKSRLHEMGIPEGALYSSLQRGETVEWQGRRITAAEVRGPERPGRGVAYSGDTLPNPDFQEAARGVDVMVHESTFSQAEAGLAKSHFHSTARQAAEIAKNAEASILVLMHVSSRYKDPAPLLEEARAVFPDTHLAHDFFRLLVPLR